MNKGYKCINLGIFAIVILAFTSLPVFAQLGNIDAFLRAGADDAEEITKAYLKPLPSGFGADINSGWTKSATPRKTFGFDIQIRAALSIIPGSDQKFDLNNLDLQKTRPADPSNTISPTVGGNDEPGPEVVVEENGDELARFNLPEGSGFNFVPAPMIQASIGLVRSTHVTVRYIPEVTFDDNKFNMKGLGIQHGINQWLPGGNTLPVNISVMGGFTNIDVSSKLNLPPEGAPNDAEAAAANYDNQEASVSLNTFTLKAFVGKDLPFISFYGGLGYETAKMDVDVEGNYPVNVTTPLGPRYDLVQDPFSYGATGENKFSVLGGVTLKMAFFHIFGEFSLSKYSTANAGVAISFR